MNTTEDDDDEDDSTDFLLRECSSAKTRMDELRKHLLDQQLALKRIIPLMAAAKKPVEQTGFDAAKSTSETIRSTLEPIDSSLDSIKTGSDFAKSSSDVFDGPKVCPMCESQFSATRFSQEDFEAHVLAHFQVSK